MYGSGEDRSEEEYHLIDLLERGHFGRFATALAKMKADKGPDFKPDLSVINLRYIDKPGIDLSGTDLREGSFKDGKLDGANFENCQLDMFHFDGASLKGANFNGASLDSVHFGSTDLTGATFIGADLRGTIFREHCEVEGADFTGATFGSRKMFDIVTRRGGKTAGATIEPKPDYSELTSATHLNETLGMEAGVFLKVPESQLELLTQLMKDSGMNDQDIRLNLIAPRGGAHAFLSRDTADMLSARLQAQPELIETSRKAALDARLRDIG